MHIVCNTTTVIVSCTLKHLIDVMMWPFVGVFALFGCNRTTECYTWSDSLMINGTKFIDTRTSTGQSGCDFVMCIWLQFDNEFVVVINQLSWPRLLPVDDICGLPTPWNCWYGELGLSSAPETSQFRPQPFGTVYQQLWDCLPAQFRYLHGNWKLSTLARRRSTFEDHLFCTTLQIHSLLLLFLLDVV